MFRRLANCPSSLFPASSAAALLVCSTTAAAPTACPSASPQLMQCRSFNTHGRMTHEYNFGNKLADIPVLNGTTKPLTRDGEWTCSYVLTENMRKVVPKILKKHGFSPIEIDREMSELFPALSGFETPPSWSTVEDFQKTPWFRRFRPNVGHSTFCSYECMKILEAELVPPSMRNDPYSALRKRHMEDQFMNVRSSEVHARSIRRSDLAKQTKGMPEASASNPNAISRKSYLAFCKEFDSARGGQIANPGESYGAWVSSVTKEGNFVGKN